MPPQASVADRLTVGLISDTHGYLDPVIPARFEGVDHILHAGDIGSPKVLFDLERIAPVTAVLGNNDHGLPLRELERIRLGTREFLLHHIVDLQDLQAPFWGAVRRIEPHVVIYGHSHRAAQLERDGRLFINPGYSGRPRLGLTRTAALMHLTPETVRVELLPL